MKPKRYAVALVIKDEDGNFLIVKRPDDLNDQLAGVWGFPAVTLREGETELEGCQRTGITKLGIEVKVGKRIGSGNNERKTFMLYLTDYEAKILKGTPIVPQADTSVTQYDECKFTNDATLLHPAARKGSVCTKVFLRSIGKNWDEL